MHKAWRAFRYVREKAQQADDYSFCGSKLAEHHKLLFKEDITNGYSIYSYNRQAVELHIRDEFIEILLRKEQDQQIGASYQLSVIILENFELDKLYWRTEGKRAVCRIDRRTFVLEFYTVEDSIACLQAIKHQHSANDQLKKFIKSLKTITNEALLK